MVFEVFRMVLVVAQPFWATKSAIRATERLNSHMTSHGKVDKRAFYINKSLLAY